MLTDVERVITFVSHCYNEIINGGLGQFYYNDTGDYAVETVWALKEIEAFDSASPIEEANALFTVSGSYLRNSDERFPILQRLWQSSESPLDSLTDFFTMQSRMRLQSWMITLTPTSRSCGIVALSPEKQPIYN